MAGSGEWVQGQHDLGESLIANRKEKAQGFPIEDSRGLFDPTYKFKRRQCPEENRHAGQTEECKSSVQLLQPLCEGGPSYSAFGASAIL